MFGDALALDVDFHLIEVVERAWGMSADGVIAELQIVERIPRFRVAEVLLGWLANRGPLPSIDPGDGKPPRPATRAELREEVMTAPPELFYRYAVTVQSALLYCLRHMDDEKWEEVRKRVEGLDVNGEGAGKKSPPT